MRVAAEAVRLDFDDYVLYTEMHPDGAFELIDGVIYKLAPEGDAHLRTRSSIQMYLSQVLDLTRYTPWTEASFPAAGWIDGPKPDNLVSRGPWLVDGKMSPRPQAKDIALIIEVSPSSRRKDGKRAALFSELIVPEYWIVDLEEACVVVHRDPNSKKGMYRSIETLGRGEIARSSSVTGLTIETDFLLQLAAHEEFD